jgi:hypothetical protein
VPPARRPTGLTRDRTLKSGIDVEVTAPAGSASEPRALAYGFRIGAQPPPAYAPKRVVWGENGATYQLNTGSNVLNAYDYLYDSDRGVIGFRPRRPASRRAGLGISASILAEPPFSDRHACGLASGATPGISC